MTGIVNGHNGHFQNCIISMASFKWEIVPMMWRYMLLQLDFKAELPLLRYESEGKRTQRTFSMLYDSYGF